MRRENSITLSQVPSCVVDTRLTLLALLQAASVYLLPLEPSAEAKIPSMMPAHAGISLR